MIQSRIDAARSALWRAELTRQILRGVLVGMAAMLAWVVMDQWIWSPGMIGRVVVASIAILAAVVYVVRSVWPVTRSSVRADYAARALERDHPELGHALSSYVTLTAQNSASDSAAKGHLSKRVVQSIGATTAAKLRSIDALPEEATGLLRWWIATIALMSVLMIYAIASPKNALQSAARLMAPAADIRPANRVQITDVQPGDAEILAGRTVEVSANVRGLRKEESVEFRWLNSSSKESSSTSGTDTSDGRTTEMQVDEATSTASTLAYTASINVSHQATGVQRYEIVAGDAIAGPFEWTIRDTPVVSVTEVQYQPPAYTGETSRVRRSGSIRGVDGTRVILRARVNRPVARAVVEFNPKPMGQDIRATAGAREMTLSDDGTSLELPFDLRSGEVATRAVELTSYRIRVWDQAEQTNSDPIIYPIEVIRDLPPEITIVVPRRSPKPVPLDAQQLFEIHAADVDFGLSEIEIEIRRGIDVIARASLWKSESGEKGNQIAEYRFRPSRMILANAGRRGSRASRLMVGDEVEVVAIATDNRSDANNPNIQPGVTRTEPVLLQIVAGRDPDEQTPEEQDDNDGQTPDDGGSPEGSGDGEEGQSGGGGGSGESGQSEQGGQGGEGQSGSGESNSEQTGENENGGEGSSDGNSSGGDSSSNESEQNDSSESNSDSESGNSTSDGNGNSESGESSNGNPGEGSTDPNAMSEGANESNGSESGTGESGASGSSTDQTSQPSDNQQPGEGSPAGNQEPGQQNSNQEGTGQQSGDAGDQGSAGSPESGGDQDGSGGSRQPQSAPQDDAEAFERINEYLKEQQENNAGQQPSGEQQPGDNQGDNQTQNGSDDSNSPEGSSQNGNSPEESQDGSGTDSQSSENGSGKKEAGEGSSPQGSQSEGSPSDDASSGDAGEKTSETDASQTGSESSDAQTGEAGQQAGEPGQPNGEPGQQNGEPGQPQDDTFPSEDGNAGEDGSAETGSQNAGDSNQSGGDGSEPNGDGSEQGTPNDQTGDQNSSNQNASSDASPGGSEKAGSKGEGSQSQSESNSGDTSNFSGDSSANGNLSGEGESEAELPKADPADMEYTKRATDMVLDYLDENRQDPDQNLLDRLKWTPEDLQRFRERWQNVKPIDQPGAAPNLDRSDVEEALRSLGMRAPKTMRSQSAPGEQDGQRGLQDSGNRRQAPAAVRDAFEAFRRGWDSSR
ncbi:midas domain-containing protein [Rhodopirellula bahusiensis]|uniref:Circumsporozoite protein-membrane associated protein n=1 Tax=Rhodopirellula bahusiensis TaxID=2014065 RepID=A0A2G1W0H4_9BACT|nr:circumsporozoite protein- membrane associated protein [Rhodopirellula bahusiensis]PHQ32517.1 circumsporozoite protein- membrane associated protein [Rhodopirellula bahusiensis]